MRKRMSLVLMAWVISSAFGNGAFADETALFTATDPDVVFLLDASGSMNLSPSGDSNIYNNDQDCMGTTWRSRGGASTPIDCRRFAIAKRSIFGVMDDNRDGVISSSDRTSLGILIGYGIFGSDSDGSDRYSVIRRAINTPYSSLYCRLDTSCNSADIGLDSYGNAKRCSALNPPRY